MTKTMQDIDMNATPEEIVEKLLAEAAETGKMQPMGQSIDFIQQQLSGLYNQIHMTLDRLGAMVGQLQVRSDTARLTTAMLINMMIEKGLLNKEEFDARYKEKVVDVMEKAMQEFSDKQKAMQEEMAKIERAEAETEDTPNEDGEVKPSGRISLVPEEPEEEEETPEEYADIVLASEAAKRIKFDEQ
jgi:hypothetical protein